MLENFLFFGVESCKKNKIRCQTKKDIKKHRFLREDQVIKFSFFFFFGGLKMLLGLPVTYNKSTDSFDISVNLSLLVYLCCHQQTVVKPSSNAFHTINIINVYFHTSNMTYYQHTTFIFSFLSFSKKILLSFEIHLAQYDGSKKC